MSDSQSKNNLTSKTNALRADREDIKAYLGLMGFDGSTMTENHLSPKAVAEMRQTIAKTLAGKNGDGWGIVSNYPDDDPNNTHMKHVTGRVAPSNIRQVSIGGVPYYQILDKYDFDAAEGYEGTWANALMEGAMDLAHYPLDALNIGKDSARGYLNYPYNAERFAGKLGLSRNINYLIPLDPGRIAPNELIEMYRQKTNLPYPSKTLGRSMVNALTPKRIPGEPYEKVMP